MNAYAEKVDIIQWVASLNDKSTLKQLKQIKEQSETKRHEMFDSISMKEHESILRGLQDSANERVTSHSDVRKRYEKWL